MSARKRLLVIAHDVSETGGQERVTFETVRRLKDDYEVTVMSSTLPLELRRSVVWSQIRLPRRPFIAKFVIYYLLGTVRVAFYRLTNPRAVIVVLGSVVANRVDASVVHFCHAAYTLGGTVLSPSTVSGVKGVLTKVSRRISLASERWTYRSQKSRLLVAVSEGLAQELHQYYPAMPVRIAHNGVDLDRFRPDGNVRSKRRQLLGLGRDAPVAIFVGGDWHRKGLFRVIEAIALLPGMTLLVAGAGDRAELAAAGVKAGVSQQIIDLGVVPDVENYLPAADLLVLPSTYEAAPLVGYEAAAAGLPIVATDVNGLGEFIRRYRCGVVVEAAPEAIASGIKTALTNREKLSRAAITAAAASTWDNSARELHQALLSLEDA